MDQQTQGANASQGEGGPQIIEVSDAMVFKHPKLGEIPAKDLETGVLRMQDYTRKTQALAAERNALAEREQVVSQNYDVLQAMEVLLNHKPELKQELGSVIQNGFQYTPAPQGAPAPQGTQPTMNQQQVPPQQPAPYRPDPNLVRVAREVEGLKVSLASKDIDQAVLQLHQETGTPIEEIEASIVPEVQEWYNPKHDIMEQFRRSWRATNHSKIERGELAGSKILQKIAAQGPGVSATQQRNQQTEGQAFLDSIFKNRTPLKSMFAQRQ